MRRVYALLAVVCGLAATARALQQPNGTTIPTPVVTCGGGNMPIGLGATFACACTQPNVCNIGAVCPDQNSCDNGQHGTCETTLHHSFNDNTCIPSNLGGLDPVKEASVTPDTFHPTCPLTFTVVTRGTALFGNSFGWYNVTGQKPDPADLHLMLDCKAKAGDQVVLDVKNQPAYKGGDIAFFLATPEQHGQFGKCAGGDCCATVARVGNGEGYLYYSQRDFNPDHDPKGSYIHLLVFNSHVTPRKFYFAWEDIYGGSDNEFTDLVTSVQGVECSGAGANCDTGMKGICALGIARCEQGVLKCEQLYQSRASESCNGLDDDCNGLVDDGATCPNKGELCWNGECVPHCSNSEFPCATDYQCDDKSGLCVDPACAMITCPGDQICRKGKCGAACDGITCPHGQVCRLGNCLDPCKGVSCNAGEVCAGGFCVPGCGRCDGLQCAAGLTCDMVSGGCGDPSCPKGCAKGTHCDHGACKDDCDGAVCPRGQVCTGGDCQVTGQSGDGGIYQNGADAGGDAGNGGGNPPAHGVNCGCRVGAARGRWGWAAVSALALCASLLGRRRRAAPARAIR